MQLGAASSDLRQIFGEFGYWMASGCPPWASYMALVLGHLIGLNKCPGMRPVGVGDTWRRLLENCALAVTGQIPWRPVGQSNYVGKWNPGYRGEIHVLQLLWQQHAQ